MFQRHGAEANGTNGVWEDVSAESSFREGRIASIAGACLALAIKFAGTCESRTFELIWDSLLDVESAVQSCSGEMSLRISLSTMLYLTKPSTIFSLPARGDQGTLLLCLNQIALALSVLTAGSGSLKVLRKLRGLYRRKGTKGQYGSYMSLAMAIGFLFLGGGCFSFGHSKEAVAYLLISIYPRFPNAPQDNHYHLQALR